MILAVPDGCLLIFIIQFTKFLKKKQARGQCEEITVIIENNLKQLKCCEVSRKDHLVFLTPSILFKPS